MYNLLDPFSWSFLGIALGSLLPFTAYKQRRGAAATRLLRTQRRRHNSTCLEYLLPFPTTPFSVFPQFGVFL